ncbi:MAG: CHASE2 domain-containing protein, partial [Phycisphaeraceae bacterium]
NSLIGLLLTLVVLAADWNGGDGTLGPMERWLFDIRARQCQYFSPPPTDKLVHINIDDTSLQLIGQWPWKRTLIANMVREMDLAGAAAIGFDVLFAEAEPMDHTPLDAKVDHLELRPPRPPLVLMSGRFEQIDHNLNFANAVRAFGKVMLPASFKNVSDIPPLENAIARILIDDLTLDQDQVRDRLKEQGHTWATQQDLASAFRAGRNLAMYTRIARTIRNHAERQEGQGLAPGQSDEAFLPAQAALDFFALPYWVHIPRRPLATEEEVIAEIFGKRTDVADKLPPGQLRTYYNLATSFYHLRRLSRPLPPGLPLILPVQQNLAPVPSLSEAISSTSFVDYNGDQDGVVRTVSLWQECEGRLYPQFALMLACATLGVDINKIELTPDTMVLPLPDGTRRVIPVFNHYVKGAGFTCGMHMYVPWFGSTQEHGWVTMFDFGRYQEGKQQLPAFIIWQVLEAEDRLRRNVDRMTIALKQILKWVADHEIGPMERNPPTIDDLRSLVDRIEKLYKVDPDTKADEVSSATSGLHTASQKEIDEVLSTLPDDHRLDMTLTIEAARILPRLAEETLRLKDSLDRQRQRLRADLEGRAVIVGWTAVGRQDVVSTSLYSSTPGPLVHGVLFSAFMTGDFWTKPSPWITRAITLVMGIAITAIVIVLSPFNALLICLMMGALYAVFNGVFLFDYHNLVIGAAGPLLTIAVVYIGCTLVRFIVEQAARKHIEGKFRSYVDPALVNYVIEHREKVRLDGQVREMSVVFTDLAGFTTLSEKLQERTVPMLNDYMGRMVKLIRDESKPFDRRGLLNKFLGDGIMFFFGAPYDNHLHAIDAVSTVLRMQNAMVEFNDHLSSQGLPSVKMRAGVATGRMVVGNAGSIDAADYTVLGPVVNFSARLESANKAMGSLVLINARAAELCRELFLLRPVAKLQVVGVSAGEMVYEPLCYREDAGAKQKLLVKLTQQMVDTFTKGDFDACLGRVAELDVNFGASKLTLLYQMECEQLKRKPRSSFDGTIVLTEK